VEEGERAFRALPNVGTKSILKQRLKLQPPASRG